MQLGQKKKYKLAALLLLLSALLVLLLPGWAARREGFQLTLLDVGQGDALLVSADGYNVLIDGGGRPTDITGMAERVVIPYLKAQGIGRLDVVFNTHPDTDHIGGLLRCWMKCGWIIWLFSAVIWPAKGRSSCWPWRRPGACRCWRWRLARFFSFLIIFG